MEETLRNALVKLAFEHPNTQPVLVPFLKTAMVFPTREALEKYLKAHPAADKTKHSVHESVKPRTKKTKHFKLPKSRFDNKKVKFYDGSLTRQIDLDHEIAFFDKKLKVRDILDLTGISSLSTISECNIAIDSTNLILETVEVNPWVDSFIRKLGRTSKGSLFLYNDSMFLSKKAPKGLGTRVFANQVAKARDMGISYIKCNAYRDDDSNRTYGKAIGYKVWPKMGYDGDVPDKVAKKIPLKFLDKFAAAGLVGPHPQVSWFYRVEGGEEWWGKNGDSFDGCFDLTAGSYSLEIHEKYIAKKAAESDMTVEDFMNKVAAKDKPLPKKGDNVTLLPEDHKILDEIWSEIRAENERKYQASLAAKKE